MHVVHPFYSSAKITILSLKKVYVTSKIILKCTSMWCLRCLSHLVFPPVLQSNQNVYLVIHLTACSICMNFRMSMTSDVQSQISKSNVIAVGGNLAVKDNSGGAAATAVLRHEFSSVSSIEFMAAAGLRALIGLQTSR